MRKCRLCKKALPKVSESNIYQKAGFCACECLAQHSRDKVTGQLRREQIATDKKARAEHREAKIRIKSRQKWVQEAQTLINRIVVIEDAPKGCISCTTDAPVTDSGHYFHRGNRYRVSPLTLLRSNLNGQCELCNRWEGGKQHDYMTGFVARHGEAAFLELVEFRRLVDCGEIKPLAIEQCKELIIEYKAKLKALKSERAAA